CAVEEGLQLCRMEGPLLAIDEGADAVFIGADPMDEAWIRKELDACLIRTDAFVPERWRELPDPFANWNRQAA
ncbi:hypothetical protein ACC840_36385, partial [Rhizobium ruizarguesonis]